MHHYDIEWLMVSLLLLPQPIQTKQNPFLPNSSMLQYQRVEQYCDFQELKPQGHGEMAILTKLQKVIGPILSKWLSKLNNKNSN